MKEKLLKEKMFKEKPQSFKEIGWVRKSVMAAAVMLFLFSFMTGIFCIGSIPPACIAAFIFACAWFWNVITGEKKRIASVLLTVMWCIIALGSTLLIYISCLMIGAYGNTLPQEHSDEVTVVVLGCKINADRPSMMLHDRLEVAADYLAQNTSASCVVCGGQGDDEDYAEAYIMKKYLVAKGIDADRIYLEDTSKSTVENLGNAYTVIKDNSLPETIMIVSDRFHQYRAQRIARGAGFEQVYALPNITRWFLAMPYWFREIAGIIVQREVPLTISRFSLN